MAKDQELSEEQELNKGIVDGIVEFVKRNLQERRQYRNDLISELIEPYQEQWWERKYGITSQIERSRRS